MEGRCCSASRANSCQNHDFRTSVRQLGNQIVDTHWWKGPEQLNRVESFSGSGTSQCPRSELNVALENGPSSRVGLSFISNSELKTSSDSGTNLDVSQCLEPTEPHPTAYPIVEDAVMATNEISPSLNSLGHHCICIVCLSAGEARHQKMTCFPCRVQGCREAFSKDTSSIAGATTCLDHEKRHFLTADRKYKCAQQICHAATKKFSDLKRHYTSTHCANRTKYPCSVIGCKYSGNNGFPRKDKLKDHFNNMHKGNFPATGGPPALATPVARTYGPRNGDTEGHH